MRDGAMRLLVASVAERSGGARSDDGRPPEPAVIDAAMDLAGYHGVSGFLRDRLAAGGWADETAIEPLQARYAANVRRHMQTLWTVSRLAPVIDGVPARWAVIKGPIAVELLYSGAAGRRSYVDLDLLVEPGAFAKVLDALASAGAHLLDRNWRMLRRDLRGELHLATDEGTSIDLHWHVINMYRGRMRFDTDDVLGRTERVDVAGVSVPTLDPTDGLLHLGLHAALAGGDRLIWLKDIERSVVTRGPDWDALVERSLRWRIGGPVGLMLARSRAVLDAPVPAWVTDRILPAHLARLDGLVGRISPWEFGLGRLAAPTRLLARSSGHGLLGGAAWIAWRGIRNLDRGQEHRSSSFTPRGDDRDRAAFIEAVVRSSVNRP